MQNAVSARLSAGAAGGHQTPEDSTWCYLRSKHAWRVPQAAGVVVHCMQGASMCKASSHLGLHSLQPPPWVPSRGQLAQACRPVNLQHKHQQILAASLTALQMHPSTAKHRLTVGAAPGSLIKRCRDDRRVHVCKQLQQHAPMHSKGQASIYLASYNMHLLLIAPMHANGQALIV